MKRLLILALPSLLSAQDPGIHRIRTADAQTMIGSFTAAPAKPANLVATYRWDRTTVAKMLAAPGATKLRFHLVVNADGDVTLVPASMDDKGTVLQWAGIDAATGAAMNSDQATAAHQVWRGARWHPRNAPHTITYPASVFAWAMSLPGAATLQTSMAMDATGAMTVVSTVLAADGTPITDPTTSEQVFLDAGDPCPPAC